MCSNIDCKGKSNTFFSVTLKEEYLGAVIEHDDNNRCIWCADCVETDSDMIKSCTVIIIDGVDSIKGQLIEYLSIAKDWEKMKTPIPGVFVVKIPATKYRPALLYLEIIPLNEKGNLAKRKGLYVGTKETLDRYITSLRDEKVAQLLLELEKINPTSERYEIDSYKSLKM